MTTNKITRSRGRPSVFNREEAVQTALALFRQKGYEGVGVAELGAAIGIKPPSLYAAFGSKQGLFEAAIELCVVQEGGFIAKALDSATTLEDAVRDVLVKAANMYSRLPHKCGCLVLEEARSAVSVDAQATAVSHCNATRVYLDQIFCQLGSGDSRGLANYVLTAMTGLSGAARQGVGRKELVKAAESFAKAVTCY